LSAVSRGLDTTQGATQAGKAAAILLSALGSGNDRGALFQLCQGLRAVGGKLGGEDASKAAEALVAVMGKVTDPWALPSLAGGLSAVSRRLDAGQAAAHAGKAADLLVAAMGRTSNLDALSGLSRGLTEVSGLLEATQAAAHANRTAAALVAAWGQQRDNPLALIALSEGLGAVGGRLEPAGGVKAAEVLVAGLGTASGPLDLNKPCEALNAVCGRLSTRDLVACLQHPLAAGRAQRTLLDVLGQRSRRDFRTTWHFLDWAASNGVDLAPPKQSTDGSR
jgi:hypothetical protein